LARDLGCAPPAARELQSESAGGSPKLALNLFAIDPPPVPMEMVGKLRTFGFVTPNGLSGLAIADRGRGALLEQDMRGAEDR